MSVEVKGRRPTTGAQRERRRGSAAADAPSHEQQAQPGDGGSSAAAMPVEFQPIQPLRAHEHVAEQIRRQIALRLIRPGQSLPGERELTSMFGVGRPTIQQALRLLEADRLIEARRGRGGGTFVLEPGEDAGAMQELMARVLMQSKELEELLDYRLVLEPAVAGEAARSRRRGDIASMRRALRTMDTATSEAVYMGADTEFHIAIGRATGNRFMEAAMEDMRLRCNDALSLLPESEPWHQSISREHALIFDAIEARQQAAAVEAMEAHVRNSAQSVRAMLVAIRRGLGS